MIQIIAGQTGEGKTKQMLQLANENVAYLSGTVVYVDSTTDHRYDLSHKVRLIEAPSFPISSPSDLLGFLCGILSANHDIELIFIDDLVKITHVQLPELTDFFKKLYFISQDHNVNFILSVTHSEVEIPKSIASYLAA